MFSPSTIKAIQDIMRQDVRRSVMLHVYHKWFFYLKILDDEDKVLEIVKINPPLRFLKISMAYMAGPDGMTGDKLIDFVKNDLLPD